MPRKTDANNPADWLWRAEVDMEVIRMATDKEIGFTTCRSKLAEVLEKVLKAELIRLGWALEKTHDLDRLLDALVARQSDLGPPSNLCAMRWQKFISLIAILTSTSTILTGRL